MNKNLALSPNAQRVKFTLPLKASVKPLNPTQDLRLSPDVSHGTVIISTGCNGRGQSLQDVHHLLPNEGIIARLS